MPFDYPPHFANSNWLSDQGQSLAHFKNHLTTISKGTIQKLTYTKLIRTQEQQKIHLF